MCAHVARRFRGSQVGDCCRINHSAAATAAAVAYIAPRVSALANNIATVHLVCSNISQCCNKSNCLQSTVLSLVILIFSLCALLLLLCMLLLQLLPSDKQSVELNALNYKRCTFRIQNSYTHTCIHTNVQNYGWVCRGPNRGGRQWSRCRVEQI